MRASTTDDRRAQFAARRFQTTDQVEHSLGLSTGLGKDPIDDSCCALLHLGAGCP